MFFFNKPGCGGHLGHVTKTINFELLFPHPKESPYENGVQLANSFKEV